MIDFAEGAAVSIFELLFTLVLIIVVSIYMLLDMPRLTRAIDRRFAAARRDAPAPAVEEHSSGYVKGQALLVADHRDERRPRHLAARHARLGATGADDYALLGVWVGLMELIPYLGPWLGAIPPCSTRSSSIRSGRSG